MSVRPPNAVSSALAAERPRRRPASERNRRDPGDATMTNDATQPVIEFLERFTSALGVNTTTTVEQTSDGPRINIAGDDAEILVRHRGEPLKALQHVVDMAYGRALPNEKRLFVDALEYRKGKDVELRQMARLLAEKAKETGLGQQLG